MNARKKLSPSFRPRHLAAVRGAGLRQVHVALKTEQPITTPPNSTTACGLKPLHRRTHHYASGDGLDQYTYCHSPFGDFSIEGRP